MKQCWVCEFHTLDDTFNFGRYVNFSIADVLDINPSYVEWCVKYCTGVRFLLYDSVIEQIVFAYPKFIMDNMFKWYQSRHFVSYNSDLQESDDEYDECCEDNEYNEIDEAPSYDKYSGTWAQDEAGFSDDEIDILFDGDPSAYWNID